MPRPPPWPTSPGPGATSTSPGPLRPCHATARVLLSPRRARAPCRGADAVMLGGRPGPGRAPGGGYHWGARPAASACRGASAATWADGHHGRISAFRRADGTLNLMSPAPPWPPPAMRTSKGSAGRGHPGAIPGSWEASSTDRDFEKGGTMQQAVSGRSRPGRQPLRCSRGCGGMIRFALLAPCHKGFTWPRSPPSLQGRSAPVLLPPSSRPSPRRASVAIAKEGGTVEPPPSSV